MATIYDVNPNELIEEAAKELLKIPEMQPPIWANYVKTGMHKERPPARQDWWFVRSAAVLRTISLLGPIGVSKLRTKYGGRKNRGYAPDRTYKGSGSILRKILQQLEKAGYVKQGEKGNHKGRIITAEGMSFLDGIASKLAPDVVKKKTAKKTKKKEEKKADKAEKTKKEEKKPQKEKQEKTEKAEEKPKKSEKEKVQEKKSEKPKKEEKTEVKEKKETKKEKAEKKAPAKEEKPKEKKEEKEEKADPKKEPAKKSK